MDGIIARVFSYEREYGWYDCMVLKDSAENSVASSSKHS